ncbi:MAG: oligopeptide/dipeptide ABC transporter ATP-binding protein [Pseudomonadota bacterium]
MSAVIEAQGLARHYRVSRGIRGADIAIHAVSDVSFSVERGQVLGLVGESGCGKSTLARLLLGLEAPSAGTVLIDGRAVTGMGRLERARKTQIVFQDPNASLNPRKSILSILTMPLHVHGIGDRRERERRAAEMLDHVGLPKRVLHNRPGSLSGGQRQRVAIARALIVQPEILICDEPTSALDVSVQAQILNLLQDLRDELGLTYILISHNLAVIEHMASRVAVMYLGRIVEENSAREIFARPRHPYTKALLDSVLTLDPTQDLKDVELGTDFPDPAALPTGCPFHPRCPEIVNPCQDQAPPQVRCGTGFVACHLYAPTSGDKKLDVTQSA